MKAKTDQDLCFHFSNSNFHNYITKFWKPHTQRFHIKFITTTKKITKDTGIAIIIVRILRKQDEDIDYVNKSGQMQKFNLG